MRDFDGVGRRRRRIARRFARQSQALFVFIVISLFPLATSFSSLLRVTSISQKLSLGSVPSTLAFRRMLCISYTSKTEPSGMKLKEIQSELKEKGIRFDDCFDRESLTKRLVEAREGKIRQDEKAEKDASENKEADQSAPAPSGKSDKTTSFDREAVLAELRSLRVKELRTECATRNIRWAQMIEKEELVQALLKAREKAGNFSASGALSPGQVSDIDDNVLSAELQAGGSSTPLLLDVYATWCGPCQMMAPQLEAAAAELGDLARVAKIDSDKYPTWASQLRVGGLPTVIVFDGISGKELERVEGALMKDGLVQLVRKHL